MHEKKLYFCRKLPLTKLSASYFGAELFSLGQNLQIATVFFYTYRYHTLCGKHKRRDRYSVLFSSIHSSSPS